MTDKLALTELGEMARRDEKIVMVTAYDHPSGRLADAAGVDVVLVGDSAAMTVLGHDSTVPVTVEEMLMLTGAVTRGVARALVVADMPFGSFQVSDEEAVRNAIRFVKEAGADAVKIEGAGPTLSRVLALVGAGIPVMGHLGLTPQSATMLGGFRAQGKTAAKARRLLEDAVALEQAGCFALVLEAVPAAVAARISDELSIPTIGIGSGAELRRPGARPPRPARALRRPHAALREALRGDRRPRSGPPSSATPPTSAPAPSRPRSTRTRCPRTSSLGSRRRRPLRNLAPDRSTPPGRIWER